MGVIVMSLVTFFLCSVFNLYVFVTGGSVFHLVLGVICVIMTGVLAWRVIDRWGER